MKRSGRHLHDLIHLLVLSSAVAAFSLSPFGIRPLDQNCLPPPMFASVDDDKNTPPLTVKQDVTTAIAVFTVDPSQQKDLIETIRDFLPTVQAMPGFVCNSLFMSIDGLKVIHHTQWRNLTEYQVFTRDERTKIQAQRLMESFGALPDVNVYAIITEASTDPATSGGESTIGSKNMETK